MPSYSGSTAKTSSKRWAGLNQGQYHNSCTLPTSSQIENTHTITRERDHPKMIDHTDIAARGADLATMTITTLTTK
jgi:hypothetical protein